MSTSTLERTGIFGLTAEEIGRMLESIEHVDQSTDSSMARHVRLVRGNLVHSASILIPEIPIDRLDERLLPEHHWNEKGPIKFSGSRLKLYGSKGHPVTDELREKEFFAFVTGLCKVTIRTREEWMRLRTEMLSESHRHKRGFNGLRREHINNRTFPVGTVDEQGRLHFPLEFFANWRFGFDRGEEAEVYRWKNDCFTLVTNFRQRMVNNATFVSDDTQALMHHARAAIGPESPTEEASSSTPPADL